MGSLFSSSKNEQTLTSQGEVNNNVIVEGTGLKPELIEALLIAILVLKLIELILQCVRVLKLKRNRTNNTSEPTESDP